MNQTLTNEQKRQVLKDIAKKIGFSELLKAANAARPRARRTLEKWLWDRAYHIPDEGYYSTIQHVSTMTGEKARGKINRKRRVQKIS